MDYRALDFKELLADRDQAVADAQFARESSKELLNHVREVSHAIEDRIQRVLERNGETGSAEAGPKD